MVGEPAPGAGIGAAAQALRAVGRFAQGDGGRHVHVGVVVDRPLRLGDPDHFLHAQPAGHGAEPAADPARHPFQHRPGALAQVVVVAGDVHLAGERQRDAHVDVLLEAELGRVAANRLFTPSGARRPGKLGAVVAVQAGVELGRLQVLEPELEQRAAGVWLGEGQGQMREGLDVPHHVALVVVVVGPEGEAEHGRAEQRGDVGRAVQVEEGGVGQLLPAGIVGVDQDPAAPEVPPALAVLLAQPVPALDPRSPDLAGGLPVGLGVKRAGHQRGHLAEHVAGAGLCVDLVLGAQGRRLVEAFEGALDRARSCEARDESGAAGAEPTSGFPQHPAVADRLIGARRLGAALQHAARHAFVVDAAGEHQRQRPVDRDRHLLQHHRQRGAAAESDHLYMGAAVRRAEGKPGV